MQVPLPGANSAQWRLNSVKTLNALKCEAINKADTTSCIVIAVAFNQFRMPHGIIVQTHSIPLRRVLF